MRASVAVLALVLTACQLLQPSPRSCTLIGCESALTVYVQHDFTDGIEYLVEACVDGMCEQAPIAVPTPADGPSTGASSGSISLMTDTDAVHFTLGDGDWSGTHLASVTVWDAATGERLIEVEEQVEFARQQPNGPGCPPICWFAEIRA